eukprot:CAMPEP_0116872170 /NCGR_PEP_ID=MMETSP0463-20121206/2867_1 /TAXON_ID=181622 /ORGANISM="Strombidinopsis sp, Strain SopsisLIS2011" /LENGTH=34 /DNA_ID= /DNA_START= /DNA_END= /DNA_ORIENTATION=
MFYLLCTDRLLEGFTDDLRVVSYKVDDLFEADGA